MNEIKIDPTAFFLEIVANGVIFTIQDPYESKSFRMVFNSKDEATRYLAKEILFASPDVVGAIEKVLEQKVVIMGLEKV